MHVRNSYNLILLKEYITFIINAIFFLPLLINLGNEILGFNIYAYSP